MRKIFTLITIFTICASLQLEAQTRTVTGVVLDGGNNQPIPGASVIAKEDPTTGKATDLDGKFSLSVGDNVTTLVISSLGFTTQEVAIGTQSNITVKMVTADYNLDAIVVSASRRQEKILDAPASITLISPEQLKNTAAVTPMANLKGVPGVDIINTGLVQTNVVVRGFNNIFSGSLLTMVDNRYAAVPSLRANVATFIPTDNIDLERIEILRGPASALYGPNCSNGVCHMITKSPLAQEKPFMTTASIGLGFRSKMSDTILISNPIDPATGNIYADYTPLFDYENIGDRMFYTASFRHSGKINDKFGYKILFTYLDGTDWLYDDPFEPAQIQLGYQTAEGRVNVGDSIDNIRDHHIQKIGLDLRFDYKLKNSGELIFSGGMTENDGIELTGIGAGQAINWKYYYAQARYLYKGWFAQAFINGSDAGDTYLFRTGDLIIDHSKQYVGQLQHGDELMNKKLNLVYGADGIYTAPDTENTINGKNEEDDNILEVGAYIQADYAVATKFNLIGAMRYDYHNFVNQPFFSPRAAAVYKANNKNTFRLTYNRSFSAPSSNNLNLDILQLGDLTGYAALFQGYLGSDYVPNMPLYAIGNRDGFHYSYDDMGLPQFTSPYAEYLGYESDHYFSLDDGYEINNVIWEATKGLLETAFNNTIPGLGPALVAWLPESIDVSGNTVAALNLTTEEFDPIDEKNITDYSAIKNSATNTIELGWKGSLFNDKVFMMVDVYYNMIQDYVSPLTDITPNVFIDGAELAAYVTPIILENFYDTVGYNDNLADIVTATLDDNPTYGGNNDGTGVDEFINLVLAAGAGLPVGTVSPMEYPNGAKYVTYVNLGDISVFGADLGMSWYVNDDLTMQFSYSWVDKDSVELPGAQLGYVGLNAPKNKLSVRGFYDITKIDLNVGLNFRWQSSFPANSGAYVGTVEEIHDLDLTLNYTPDYIKDTQFTLLVTNLYNHEQQYFVGAPKMGSSYFFKITKSF
ncbi:MAG: TonB-dependent receptor [Bacteroidetes bacterium]|nr:TonB-dependent receptor [Bacteroidota bacterium]